MGLRRKSRETALQFLFAYDFQNTLADLEDPEATFAEFINLFEVEERSLAYARVLITGICTKRERIDALLSSCSHNWRLERMSYADRNILRIAVYEMLFSEDVPAQVAINEALEINKNFTLGDSTAFVNGILDAVQKTLS